MKSIKRPLAVTGFTFFITGSLVLSMPMGYTVVLLALFALFTFIHYKTKKVFTKQLLLMLFTAVAAAVYVNTFAYFYQNRVDSIPTDKQTYTGYVSEIYNSNNTSYKVALLDEKCREIYNVSIYYHNKLQLCDVVQITGKFKPARSDKYIFSSYADNIKGSITIDDLKVIDKDVNTVKYKCLTMKGLLLKNAEELYDNEYFAIVSAMGYNDGHHLTKSVKALFKTAGLSHALVVSGLHVGIIMLAVQWLLKHIPISKKIKNIITAVIIIVFMQI
ncbi:MAG: ComEC/Rec2 family competence protein, partial [Oscillospiraceae bacterium]|nr:ComEC/Rec2 family competence protein [Oscillospiraceae bacterium]